MLKKLKKGSAWIDQAAVSGGNFLTIALCANALDVSEQGKLGYVYACYMGLVIWNMTSLFQWASVKVPQETDPAAYHHNLAKTQLFWVIPTSALLTTALAVLGPDADWRLGVTELGLVFGFFSLQQLADFDRRAAYVFGGNWRAATSSLSVYPLRVLLLVVIWPDRIEQVLAILLLTAVGPALMTLRFTVSGKKPYRLKFMADHFTGSRWLIVSGPFMWAWGYLPVFFLGAIHNVYMVGILVTVRSLTGIVNVVMELLETAVAADAGRLLQKEGNGLRTSLLRLWIRGMAVWLVLAALMFVAGEWLLATLFGPEYRQYQDVLMLLWLAQAVTFCFRVGALEARTLSLTAAVPVGYVGGTVAVLVCAPTLIGHVGLQGAAGLYLIGATATLVAQRLCTAWMTKNR